MQITSNIGDVIKGFTEFEKKQLPYIQVLTANNIAFDVMEVARKEVRGKFRGKSLESAILLNKAKKRDIPYAEIFVSNAFRGIGRTKYKTPTWKAHALTVLEHGGKRPTKSMERAMVKAGLMRTSEILIEDGLVAPWVYVQIMSVLHLNWQAGFNANQSKASKKRKETALKNAGKANNKFFVVTSNHIAVARNLGKVVKRRSMLAPGIYTKMSDNANRGQVFRLFKIAKQADYNKKWDLKRILNTVYERRGEKHFSKAYDIAMFSAY